MKLIRFGNPGEEKPGLVLDSGDRVDTSNFGEDYNETFFQNDGLNRLEEWANHHSDSAPIIAPDIRLGPPVYRPSKIVCIGLNYKAHAKEAGMPIPDEPIIFLKSPSSMVGPTDNLILPKNSKKNDWEVELAIIIGKRASYIEKSEVDDYIAGYALMNDYSERQFQLEQGGQWVKGKSCDTFAPLGPYLATKDEIEDAGSLDMWLSVNGETKQKSNTSDMIFDVPTIVSYLSQFMTLLPGDVISTGTPQGVGMGFKPPQYLKHGDQIEYGIEGLGSASQKAIAYEQIEG